MQKNFHGILKTPADQHIALKGTGLIEPIKIAQKPCFTNRVCAFW